MNIECVFSVWNEGCESYVIMSCRIYSSFCYVVVLVIMWNLCFSLIVFCIMCRMVLSSFVKMNLYSWNCLESGKCHSRTNVIQVGENVFMTRKYLLEFRENPWIGTRRAWTFGVSYKTFTYHSLNKTWKVN